MAANEHHQMGTLLDLGSFGEIAQRSALVFPAGAEAYSGARFERVTLIDGRRLILKYLPSEGDWLTRATDGAGRLRRLWNSGTLARIGDEIDHAIVALAPLAGTDVVIMHDVSGALMSPNAHVSRSTCQRLLAGLARVHQAWNGCTLTGLCRPESRYRLFAPGLHAGDQGPNPHPDRELIVANWECFAELVPADVAEAVFAVHAHPEGLAEALLASAAPTLLHGDAKLGNLGLVGDRVVAIDWGELTGIGPAEIDVAWFAVMSGSRVDWMPDETFQAYEVHAGRRLDRKALDLACIGSLAQMGFRMAHGVRASDEPRRARYSALLGWWVTRVRGALLTWSPI